MQEAYCQGILSHGCGNTNQMQQGPNKNSHGSIIIPQLGSNNSLSKYCSLLYDTLNKKKTVYGWPRKKIILNIRVYLIFTVPCRIVNERISFCKWQLKKNYRNPVDHRLNSCHVGASFDVAFEWQKDNVNHYLTGVILLFGQCESHGIPLPTLDEVDNKASQFNDARHYMYNEDDVDKVSEQWKPGFM